MSKKTKLKNLRAKFKCTKCGHSWKDKAGPTRCISCGHKYVEWKNYHRWEEVNE